VVKQATSHQLSDRSSFYLEPDSLNVESKYYNGSVITKFSTKKDGEVGFSVNIQF
jgi:hypothetical protein